MTEQLLAGLQRIKQTSLFGILSIKVHFVNGERVAVYFIFEVMFVCFVALCPKSTTMVMTGRSVHLTTLFPGQA